MDTKPSKGTIRLYESMSDEELAQLRRCFELDQADLVDRGLDSDENVEFCRNRIELIDTCLNDRKAR